VLDGWADASVEQRRQWLAALVEAVVIHTSKVPARRGFDRDRVEVRWHF
jgi:hypothetical protein